MSDAEKPKLKRANDNPWYCLATLYGEQTTPSVLDWDRDLTIKNRTAWNRWMAARLSGEQVKDLLISGFAEAELVPLTPAEQSAFCSAFAARTGSEMELPPNPPEFIDFNRTHFDSSVSFGGFLFSGYAAFGSASFSDYTDFRSAKFFENADFMFATFSGSVDFYGATFSDYANFSSATFRRSASFYAATFSDYADFIDAEFVASTNFARAFFEHGVPDFRGAKMHEATEWHGVNWPPAPENNITARIQVYAYERLKLEMERLKKHDDEQFFFRKELRARRGLLSPGSGAWLLNYAYEVSSDYGQSIERPLLWLFVLFVSGSIFFAGSPVFKGARMTIPVAAGLSFANIFSFLPLAREILGADMVAGLSRAAQIIGVVQSLLGALLLFLLGLALRTRFRMR
jgi:uncharacterized protein YjbI with pentapeptide repeats